MAKRPSFQFYPADWRNNAKLRHCSHAARGAWIEVLCLLHDADEYGVVRWPLADIAHAAGVPMVLLRELVAKDVLKGADAGAADYNHLPSHAGKAGPPVTLVTCGAGPCWYSSRLVSDEWIRGRRGVGTRFGDKPSQTPTQRVGDGSGDGPTSTSSSTSTKQQQKRRARAKPRTRKELTTPGAQACQLMRESGCTRTNPCNPELLAALAEGIAPELLATTAREAIAAGKASPFKWAIAATRGRHADALATTQGNHHERTTNGGKLSLVERVRVNNELAEERERASAIDGECRRIE